MYYIIIGFLAVIAAFFAWMAFGKKGAEREDALSLLQKETESLRQELTGSITGHLAIVNQQLSSVTNHVGAELRNVANQIQNSTGQINDRMDRAAKVVGDVGKNLGQLSEATKQIYEVGKDISSLQEIFKAPKLRGGFGEFLLGDLLSQFLTPQVQFELQYAFKNTQRVDAVIKLAGGIVPVDAKFPLENFKKFVDGKTDEEKSKAKKDFAKDVKNRIDEIASSYILPDEGTFDFAMMYIPAENVYYETIIKDEDTGIGSDKSIASYAFSKKVIPVSPNSFYAYLQTILLGLKGLEISKEAQSILRHLETLQNDLDKFRTDFSTLGTHLSNAKNKYDEADKKMARFDEKLSMTADSKDEAFKETEKRLL